MAGHNHSRYSMNTAPIDTLSAPPGTGTDKISFNLGLSAAPAVGFEFCRFCGQPVVVDAVLCVHYGRQIKDIQNCPVAAVMKEPERVSWHVGELIGLMLLTVLCPLVGYIYGHIGSREHGKEKQAKALMIVAAAFNILYVYAYISAHSPTHP